MLILLGLIKQTDSEKESREDLGQLKCKKKKKNVVLGDNSRQFFHSSVFPKGRGQEAS